MVFNLYVFYSIFQSDDFKKFFSNNDFLASVISTKDYLSINNLNFTDQRSIIPIRQEDFKIENGKNDVLDNNKDSIGDDLTNELDKKQFFDNDLFYFEEISKKIKISKSKDKLFKDNDQLLNLNINIVKQNRFFKNDSNTFDGVDNPQSFFNSFNIINNLNSSSLVSSSSNNNFEDNGYYEDFLNRSVIIQDNKDNEVVARSPSKNDICALYKSRNYPNILISEVKFESKDNPDDEYIEIYNPNDVEIDLSCWSLEKYASKKDLNSLPELTTILPASKFNGIIKPYSFFLITSSSTKDKYKGDLSYAQSYYLAKNNTIMLKKPNGDISDMIGYGDSKDKIYQSETEPFLSQNFDYKSVQRKNLQDLDNNLEDFWLRKPDPENSTFSMRKPRKDFIDLHKINIDNFQISVIANDDKALLKLVFKNPLANISSTNYKYNLLITDFSASSSFSLVDFGSTATLSFFQPKDQNTSDFVFETTLEKCPIDSVYYYVRLMLYDLLDEENIFISTTSSIELPVGLCSFDKIDVPASVSESYFKIFISEVKIVEGSANDEYIELYNPNNTSINLSGWQLLKYNSENKASTIISDRTKAKFKDITMQPFSYLLLSNTSTLSINGKNINVDLVYALSNDLAKNNSLVLINDKNVIVDQFSWSKPSGYHQSYSRKKIDITSEDNYFTDFTDLGNAYDSDNLSDFILVEPNPYNLSVSKPIPLDIVRLKGEFDSDNNSTSLLNITLSWISPFVYDNSFYEYKLLLSTSSDNFYPLDSLTSIVLPQFQALSLQKVKISNLNINSLAPEENFNLNNLKFKLELYKNNNKISEAVYQKN